MFQTSAENALERSVGQLALHGEVRDARNANAELGEGNQRLSRICDRSDSPTARALREWLDAAGIEAGPIFRPINKAGTVSGERLTDRSVANIVKAYAGRAGFDANRGRSERALERPVYTGDTDLIFVSQCLHSLTGGIAFRDFALLADVEGGGTTELLALLASLGDAGLGSGQNQLALKLGNAGHDRDDQFADVGGGVAPGFTEADEAAGAVLELTEDIQQVAPGDFRNNQVLRVT